MRPPGAGGTTAGGRRAHVFRAHGAGAGERRVRSARGRHLARVDVGFLRSVGYGYPWWSADVGDYRVNFSRGHGGQLIVVVHDLGMVVVLTSDPPFPGQRQDQDSWRSEIANVTLVSEFIRSLPSE